MKLFACVLTSIVIAAFCTPANAQQAKAKKKAPRTASELVINNMRQANLVEFQVSNAEGKVVGVLKAPLAPGKKTTLKLTKGSPCSLTVSVVFDDEAENAGGQIDACKDKNIRFAN